MRQHICQCGATINAPDQAMLEIAITAHNVTVHGAIIETPVIPVPVSGIQSLVVKFAQPEAIPMPSTITMQQQVPMFVDAFDASVPPVPVLLGPGQSVTVAIADPKVAAFVQDTNPAIDPNGVQSIESVVVSPVAPGTTAITATVTNADGTVAATVSDTITVTATAPGPLASLKLVFGSAVAKITQASTRKA